MSRGSLLIRVAGNRANIFEDLVRIRLMNTDRQYGLVFYNHLLNCQKENCAALLRKVIEEASLFDSVADIDSEAVHATLKTAHPDPVDKDRIESFRATNKKRERELDEMVRPEFGL